MYLAIELSRDLVIGGKSPTQKSYVMSIGCVKQRREWLQRHCATMQEAPHKVFTKYPKVLCAPRQEV